MESGQESKNLAKNRKETVKVSQATLKVNQESESESESTASDLDSTFTPKGSTRLERRKLRKKNYLEGKARQAHNISAEVRTSFEESAWTFPRTPQ